MTDETLTEPILTEGYCDYMVVFADEAEALSVLYDSSTDGEGNVTLTPKFTAVDMIGTIYEPAPLQLKPMRPQLLMMHRLLMASPLMALME